ncbi:pyrimidine 5'-nucleotidase [Pelagibaculum spongiae]|nr:pyrimidine 5'-nucleotidase [Pelagibaculum spongiae]
MKHQSMKYQWILFDADETLFHFDAFKGMKLMFSRLDINFSQQDFQQYQAVNKPLWVDYQNGDITAHQLQTIRFQAWADKLEISTDRLNELFLNAMADTCQPLEGVPEMLQQLFGKVKMGIITNGFTQLQQIRLQRTELEKYFDLLVISEQVGFAKPDSKIFQYAWDKMGQPEKSQVLMVGDNSSSDILGANRFGFDSCWYNAKQQPPAKDEQGQPIDMTLQVTNYPQLMNQI